MDAAAAGTACRSAETARNRLLIANAPRKIRADTGEPGGPKRLLDANYHFAIGLVRFHRLACLANIVESKDASRFGLIDSSGRFIHDGLKRNVRDWKVWSAEYKAAKKCEVKSARHLKQRVEVIHGIETTEPSREAHTATRRSMARESMNVVFPTRSRTASIRLLSGIRPGRSGPSISTR